MIGLILCLMENIDRIEREYCYNCGLAKDCTAIRLFKTWGISKEIYKRPDLEYGCRKYSKVKRASSLKQEEIIF